MKEPPSLLRNTTSLFFIQITSYILPLALIPYLTRVLGVESYGIVAFGLSIVAVSAVITDFGFDLYAPYVLSLHREDKNYVRAFIGAIFVCKSLLFLILFIVICVFVLIFAQNKFQPNFLLLLLFPILGTTLQPNWFYQGLEKMGTIIGYILFSRIVYFGLVLLWVKEPTDYMWVIVAYGATQTMGATFSIAKMIRIGYVPVFPSISKVKKTFFEAQQYFYSRAAVAIYTVGGGAFLGVFSTPTQVAYFSVAEQLYRGAQGLIAPIAQALYPFMVRTRNTKIFSRILLGSLFLVMISIVIGVIFGKQIIALVFGVGFLKGYGSLILFLIVLAINVPSVLLGYPFLGALGCASFVNKTVLVGGILQLITLIGIYAYGNPTATNVIIGIIVAEASVLGVRARKAIAVARHLRQVGSSRL